MNDLSRLIEDLCAGLASPDTPLVSTSVETLSTAENQQPIDNDLYFHTFQSFHSKTEQSENYDDWRQEHDDSDLGESRVASSYVEGVETAERVEREAENPTTSTHLLFPLSLDEMKESGKSGKGCEPVRAPLPDLKHTPPQRSDWWTGDLMAEVDREAPSGDQLPIGPSDVRAGVARELRALADDGREGADALRDAIEITRAKIRNSEVLAERQANGAACHVCDRPLDDTLPVIAVLTGKPGAHIFLHAGCHDVYSTRRSALVDRIMASAGYGETLTNGEVA